MFDFYGNKFTSDINHFIKKAKDRVKDLLKISLLKEIIVVMERFYKII